MLLAAGVSTFTIEGAGLAVLALTGLADAIATVVGAGRLALARIGTNGPHGARPTTPPTAIAAAFFRRTIWERALGLAKAKTPGIAGFTGGARAAATAATVVATFLRGALRLAKAGPEIVAGEPCRALSALSAATIWSALLAHALGGTVLARIPLRGTRPLQGLSKAGIGGLGTAHFLHAHKDVGPLHLGGRGRIGVTLVLALLAKRRAIPDALGQLSAGQGRDTFAGRASFIGGAQSTRATTTIRTTFLAGTVGLANLDTMALGVARGPRRTDPAGATAAVGPTVLDHAVGRPALGFTGFLTLAGTGALEVVGAIATLTTTAIGAALLASALLLATAAGAFVVEIVAGLLGGKIEALVTGEPPPAEHHDAVD
jgi:hypothetical protein